MRKITAFVSTFGLALLVATGAQAQQFEAVYTLESESTSDAVEAFDILFEDEAMKGSKVTLYSADFGVAEGSHVLVVDYDNYADRETRGAKRRASHGWSKFQLATQDMEFIAGEMAIVVADHGKPRHTAGYLMAFLLNVQDAAIYSAALEEMNDALGNPGVLRLVAMRSGSRAVTHAVLVGGDDFEAVNNYMDELYASDAFASFAAKVGDIRSVVAIQMYRRVGAWGY